MKGLMISLTIVGLASMPSLAQTSDSTVTIKRCQSRGEHFIGNLRIDQGALESFKQTRNSKFRLQRAPEPQDRAELIGKHLAKNHCSKKGFAYLHGFYWERSQPAGSPHPYSVTHVICSNKTPKNKHGAGGVAEGNDDFARIAIAKKVVEEVEGFRGLNDERRQIVRHRFPLSERIRDLARDNAQCSRLFTSVEIPAERQPERGGITTTIGPPLQSAHR